MHDYHVLHGNKTVVLKKIDKHKKEMLLLWNTSFIFNLSYTHLYLFLSPMNFQVLGHLS